LNELAFVQEKRDLDSIEKEKARSSKL
jgi:hypothetical protein